MATYEIRGKKPVWGKTSWVHETAQVVGDVTIGEDCFIGPGAALRGDYGTLIVGDRSSVQDNCSMHTRPGEKCVVGNDVTVGHGAVLHGCAIKDRSIVGINAVVSDGAVVGEDSIVAEGSVVRSGQEIPPGSLAVGVPAAIKGQLTDAQKTRKDMNALAYVELTRMYLKEAKKIT